LLGSLRANVAQADWGENWGEMIWGLGGIPLPVLDGWGLLLLPTVLVSMALLLIAKRRGPRMTLVMFVALAVPLTAYAATIGVPNVFSNGTVADADEVNTNFTVLTDESNDQDSRITALENQAAVGSDGEPCHPNNTCDAGLTCNLVTTLCEGVSIPEGSDGGICYANNTCGIGLLCRNGICELAVGGNGEPCYPNNTCSAGLTCNLVTTLCEGVSIPEGSDGGICYANNTCGIGLMCSNGICEPAVGGNGEPCYPDNTCDVGLTCNLITSLCGS
jgi:hypothetical protein